MVRRFCVPVAVALLGATLPPTLLAQSDSFDREVKKSLDKARPRLMKYLKGAQMGKLALLVLAAIHDEVPTDNKTFTRAMKRLQKARLSNTYEIALRLMVIAEYRSYPNRKKAAERDTKRLLSCLHGPGFNYGGKGGSWDLSNTQYGVLGLRAAASLQIKIKKKVWDRCLRGALGAQLVDGSFGYRDANRRLHLGTASMTAAGIAIVQICKRHVDPKVLKALSVELRLKEAWDWFSEFKGRIGDRTTRWLYYCHYGLERACILSDVKKIGGKDWYRAGAKMLMKIQKRDGGWDPPVTGHNSGRDVSTAFSILFLRRKFKKNLVTNVPITPAGGVAVDQLPEKATKTQVTQAIESEVRRGITAMPKLLQTLRSKVPIRRRAALQAVIRITGKDFGYRPFDEPEKNDEAIKAAELWYLKNRKKWHVPCQDHFHRLGRRK